MLLQNVSRIVAAAMLGVASTSAAAGQVDDTDLVTFAEDTPALAQEVNGNFTSLKDAINDNDLRITAIAGGEGRVFIAPSAFDSGTVGTDALGRFVELFATQSITATFGAPADYTGGDTGSITIRPMFSGCSGETINVTVVSNYRNIDSSIDNLDSATGTVNMDAAAGFVGAPSVGRSGMGDYNFLTVTRDSSNCSTGARIRGILVTFQR